MCLSIEFQILDVILYREALRRIWRTNIYKRTTRCKNTNLNEVNNLSQETRRAELLEIADQPGTAPFNELKLALSHPMASPERIEELKRFFDARISGKWQGDTVDDPNWPNDQKFFVWIAPTSDIWWPG